MVELATWQAAVIVVCAVMLGAAGALAISRLCAARRSAVPAVEDGARQERSSASLLSHEIRTPLALVKGAGELLAEETPGPLTATQRYFVDTVIDNTSLVIGMAEGLLLEARADTGRLVLDRTAVDIRALVRETVLELRRIRRTTVHLDSRGGPLVLEADRSMIQQVLWNLVNNAIRHAGPDAEVVVRVDSTSEGATIEVGDDGAGMTGEQRAGLFSAPAGAGSARARAAGASSDGTVIDGAAEAGAAEADRAGAGTPGGVPGTGIGMGVIRRIVDAHGGRIVVDTLVRRGTRILIVLRWPERDGADG